MKSPFQEAKSLFERCLDAPKEEWPKIEAEASTPEIQAQLKKLLLAYEQAGTHYTEIVQSKLRQESPELVPGTTLGDFLVIDRLGQGGFATVYLAKQRSIERMVALKISLNVNTSEARTLARVGHPNVVQIYSLEEFDADSRKVHALCMQYVNGPSLRALLKDPLGIDRRWHSRKKFVLELLVAMSQALEWAHSKDVLHLDLKPENILYDESGKFLLADFNISMDRFAIDQSRLGGSSYYMPPEQLHALETNGEDTSGLSEKSDLFALGRVLEECIQILGLEHESALVGLANKLTAENPAERVVTASALRQVVDMHLELLKLADQQRPRRAFGISSLVMSRPWASIAFAVLVPNLFSSAVQIQYNSLHVLPRLSEEQNQIFHDLLVPVNGVLYVLALIMILRTFQPIIRALKASASDEAVLKKGVHHLDLAVRRVTLFTSFFWFFGFATFTGSLAQHAISEAQVMHLAISFGVGLLLPLTLTRLIVSYICYVDFLPQIVSKMISLPRLKNPPTIVLGKYGAGIASLLGTFVVILVGPGQISYPFQPLASTFLAAGMVSFIVGAEISERIVESWESLQALSDTRG